MATQAYWNWVSAGRPWKVAAPIKQFGDRLRGYGYTVYYLGSDDASHLQASRPQDHCPFSFTGWPVAHPYPYVTACDVMPPPAGSGLPSLQQLGAQIVADRNAGVAGTEWLKYMNWEPDRDWGGRCWQDSWKPSHSRTSSSDRGHIHASGRSDMVVDPGPAYDPVARIRGTAPQAGGDDMPLSPQDLVAVWSHDVQDDIGGVVRKEPAYRALLRAADGVDALRAAAAASAQREQDLAAAVTALTGLIAGAGGNVDAAAVVAGVKGHIDQRSADVTGRIAELEEALADRDARLAAALAGS